jgi:hypothetical protein
MKAMVCRVCEYNTDPAMARCGRCGWELRDSEFFDSLKGPEQERYLRRRDLARARWNEFRGYDQSPRKGSFTAQGTMVRGGPTSSGDLPIGGRLL